jgi:hypothetical protein
MASIAKPTKAKRTHKKPAVPSYVVEAEKVADQMYSSLKAPDAPKAHPLGYIIGASIALKMLIDQAVKLGEDRDALKAQAMTYIQIM